MKLTAKTVHDLSVRCSFVDGDEFEVEGIIRTFLFSKTRLEERKDEIISLLNELPETFQASKGGGGSFLNACYDKHENHWGEHPSMELLFALGIGIGKVSYLMPREMWEILPGGMPYVVIKD